MNSKISYLDKSLEMHRMKSRRANAILRIYLRAYERSSRYTVAVSVVTLRFPITYDVVLDWKSFARLAGRPTLDENIKRSSSARVVRFVSWIDLLRSLLRSFIVTKGCTKGFTRLYKSVSSRVASAREMRRTSNRRGIDIRAELPLTNAPILVSTKLTVRVARKDIFGTFRLSLSHT